MVPFKARGANNLSFSSGKQKNNQTAKAENYPISNCLLVAWCSTRALSTYFN